MLSEHFMTNMFSLPSKYSQGLTLLSLQDQTRSGAFKVIWPYPSIFYLKTIHKATLSYLLHDIDEKNG